jgi:WD repeat and FYVE domain-containing protein 2
LINVLKGHNGSIQTITWEGKKGWLFTGSYDSSIFVWDVAGRKGTVFELHGHRNKVNCIAYVSDAQTLMSVGEDTNLVLWNMAAKRLETSDWSESDTCQLCSRPFFWNLKAMYDQKQIGLRQHHCRKCGKAICDSCSTKRSTLPLRGHEFPVRVCEECYIKITEDEKQSLARFYDMKSSIRYIDFDANRKLLITVGNDHLIKIWKIRCANVIKPSSVSLKVGISQ